MQFYGEEVMRLVKTLYEVCDELKITRRMVQGYENAGLVSPFLYSLGNTENSVQEFSEVFDLSRDILAQSC